MMTRENTTGGVVAAMLNNTASLRGIDETSLTWLEILTTVIGILAVVLNGSLLIAMVRYRSTIFTSKGAYLVANMAMADLLTGLNSSLLNLKKSFQFSENLTKAMFSIISTIAISSFLTIFVMSLERCIAIGFPIKAKVWLSKTRTIKSCVAVWSIATLSCACTVVFGDIVSFCFSIVFEITILCTMFFYYQIAIKLKQRRTFLTSMQPTGDRGMRSNADLQRDCQMTTVVVTITLIFIITALLYMVAGNILLVRRLFTVANYDSQLQLFIQFYFPVQLINFVLNPIVYAWRLPNYRLALLRTLHCR